MIFIFTHDQSLYNFVDLTLRHREKISTRFATISTVSLSFNPSSFLPDPFVFSITLLCVFFHIFFFNSTHRANETVPIRRDTHTIPFYPSSLTRDAPMRLHVRTSA